MQQLNSCPTCGQRRRTKREHNHCFAVIQRAFESWPPSHSFQPDNVDHLRAWLLLSTGYVHSTLISEDDPRRAARTIENLLEFQRHRGVYSDFSVIATGVMVHAPRSMSESGMGKEIFQEAKVAIFGLISEVLGVSVEQLTANAMEAA